MLSAVILTKNEADKISSLIKSLSFADEVVVIDDYSTDKTTSYAKKLKARVYKRHLNNDFASQRNFGVSKAINKWVLFVDADEIVSKVLAKEILKSIKSKNVNGFYVQRWGYWLGKEMRWGEWSSSKILKKYGHNKLLRLAKKDEGIWKRRVHEYWDVKGRVAELKSPLIHKSQSSLKKLLQTASFQAQLHATANKEEGKRATFLHVTTFPLAKFIVSYFFKQGFRDGTHGFVHIALMSFHSFLAWSQLYLDQKQK